MLTEQDFSKMKYNPLHRLGQDPITVAYPKLARYDLLTEFRTIEFKDKNTNVRKNMSKGDFDLLIRFCLMTCITGGNPISDEDDTAVLFATAYECLGIDAAKSTVSSMVNYAHPLYTKICSLCFRLGNDMVYEQWSSSKAAWHQLNEVLRSPSNELDSTKISKLTHDMTAMRQSLSALESILFPSSYHAQIGNEEESMRYYAEANAKDWDY
jgi:hypothetical protein